MRGVEEERGDDEERPGLELWGVSARQGKTRGFKTTDSHTKCIQAFAGASDHAKHYGIQACAGKGGRAQHVLRPHQVRGASDNSGDVVVVAFEPGPHGIRNAKEIFQNRAIP